MVRGNDGWGGGADGSWAWQGSLLAPSLPQASNAAGCVLSVGKHLCAARLEHPNISKHGNSPNLATHNSASSSEPTHPPTHHPSPPACPVPVHQCRQDPPGLPPLSQAPPPAGRSGKGCGEEGEGVNTLRCCWVVARRACR